MTDTTMAVRGRLRERAAEEIRALLARRRISAAELARRTGLKQSTLARRMTGETAFDLDDLELIASVLGVSVAQLLPTESEGSSGQTPYSDRLTDRPRAGRPPNRRNGPSGGPGRSMSSSDTRRPVRRHNAMSVSPLPRAA